MNIKASEIGVVIEKEGLNFRKEPNTDSGKIGTGVPYNARVTILDTVKRIPILVVMMNGIMLNTVVKRVIYVVHM